MLTRWTLRGLMPWTLLGAASPHTTMRPPTRLARRAICSCTPRPRYHKARALPGRRAPSSSSMGACGVAAVLGLGLLGLLAGAHRWQQPAGVRAPHKRMLTTAAPIRGVPSRPRATVASFARPLAVRPTVGVRCETRAGSARGLVQGLREAPIEPRAWKRATDDASCEAACSSRVVHRGRVQRDAAHVRSVRALPASGALAEHDRVPSLGPGPPESVRGGPTWRWSSRRTTRAWAGYGATTPPLRRRAVPADGRAHRRLQRRSPFGAAAASHAWEAEALLKRWQLCGDAVYRAES